MLDREKWKNLGSMTRQEAMKRYTTALDNLVDDWRRSANLRSSTASIASTSSAVTDVTASPARQVGKITRESIACQNADSKVDGLPQPARKSTSLFERLPRVYEELGELQDRVEDEAKKREELEAHVLTFTRDQVCAYRHLTSSCCPSPFLMLAYILLLARSDLP